MKKKIKDLVKGLKSGYRWSKNIGEELVLKFKYLTPRYHDLIHKGYKSYTNLTPFTEEQREITQFVLDEIAVKTGLEFKMVEGTKFSNLTFGNFTYKATKDTENRLVGFAFFPNNYSGVSPIWVNFANMNNFKEIITHEIGHAIGLQHFTQAGYSSADSIMWPIISSTTELQPADILALQQLYGEDTNSYPEEREKILKRQQERKKKRELREKEQKKRRAVQEQAEQLLAKERKRRQQEVEERASKLAREREIALRQEQEWIRLEQKRVNKRRAAREEELRQAREAAEEKRQRQMEERAKEEARIVKEHEEQWQRMEEERRQMEEERKKQWERIKEERAQRKREYDQEYTKRREQRERERNERQLPAENYPEENYLAQDMSSFTFHSSLQGSFQGRLINRGDEQSHKGFFSDGISSLGDAVNLSLR